LIGVSARQTPATRAAQQAGLPVTLHEYVHDASAPAFGAEAAAKLGVDPARMFKTLVADSAGRLLVGLVPVAASLDLKALAAALGAKSAALADPAVAERATGYVRGGISPLGQRKRLPTAVDASLVDWPTVFVSGGRRGLQLELAPDALLRLTDAVVAPLARKVAA
jgi:Cys-tRNA(Pro)/Cys-tRNA(Cys) deacylase